MPFNTISATSRVADLLDAGSLLDIELTDLLTSRVTTCSSIPQVVWFRASEVCDPFGTSDAPEADFTKVRHAVLFTSRKWLVQDRSGGAMVRHGDRVFSRVGQP